MTWRKLLIAFLLFFVAFLNLSRNAVHKTDQTFSQLYVTPQSESSVVSKTSSTSAVRNVTLQCEPERPCVYSDTVQLRVIVVTYNRPSSLLKLFECLDSLELDGHSAALEIWIDRQRRTDKVDERTVKVASEFQWSRGSTRVHVHTTHVGIYGQWIDTWRPHDDSNDELALILEDDLSISKYAYRWVRAVFRAYSQRADFAGASLTSHQMVILSARPKGRLAGPSNHTVMMYKCFGTWGFAPKPLHWRRFQVSPLYCMRVSIHWQNQGHVPYVRRILLRPGRGAEYCHQPVCLSVCLSVSISLEPLDRSARHLVCRSPVAVARSSSGGLALPYALPVLWMTSRLAVMGATPKRGGCIVQRRH